MTVDAARLTAIRYGKPSFSSTLMPCSTKNSSLDRRSISALPRSFQVVGSVTTGASLVALAAAVAVASAMRCSSIRISIAGVGSGVGSAAGSCAGVGLGCTVSGAGVRLRPETTRKQPNEMAASTAKQRMPVSSALRRAALSGRRGGTRRAAPAAAFAEVSAAGSAARPCGGTGRGVGSAWRFLLRQIQGVSDTPRIHQNFRGFLDALPYQVGAAAGGLPRAVFLAHKALERGEAAPDFFRCRYSRPCGNSRGSRTYRRATRARS